MPSYRQPGPTGPAITGPIKIASGPSGQAAGASNSPAGTPPAGQATPPPGQAQAAPQAGQAPQMQPTEMQGQGTGFINLQNVLSANQPAAESMANGLAGQANTLGQGAIASGQGQRPGGADATKTYAAQDYANQLGSYGGVASLLQDKYGKQGEYNEGANALDSFLAGSAGHDKFQQAQQAYGNLSNMLNPATPPPLPTTSVKGGKRPPPPPESAAGSNPGRVKNMPGNQRLTPGYMPDGSHKDNGTYDRMAHEADDEAYARKRFGG